MKTHFDIEASGEYVLCGEDVGIDEDTSERRKDVTCPQCLMLMHYDVRI